MKKTLLKSLATAGLTTMALLAVGSVASADARLSARSIIVNPTPSPVNVRVWVDKDTSGSTTPTYYEGEQVRVSVAVSQNSYVYLFDVDPLGKVSMIFPNRYSGRNNFVYANSTRSFPDGPYTFDVSAPYGNSKVLAVASKTPLNMDDIFRFESGQNFATPLVRNQQQLAQALSIVVNPVPQNTWESDTAYYYAARGNTQVAPVYTTPMPTPRPRPTTSYPWFNVPNWHTYVSYSPGHTVGNIYETYNDQFVDAGYALIDTYDYENELWAEYSNGRETAHLRIELTNGRFYVSIER